MHIYIYIQMYVCIICGELCGAGVGGVNDLCLWSQFSGFGFRIPGSGFRVSGFGVGVGFGFQVSGL